jgi:putative transposase
VGFVKGKSAIKIFDMHLELKRRYWGRHFWAKGYCVSTVGLDEEQIKKYVRLQMHQDQTIDQLTLWKKYTDPFRVTIKPPLLGVVIDFVSFWHNVRISSYKQTSKQVMITLGQTLQQQLQSVWLLTGTPASSKAA